MLLLETLYNKNIVYLLCITILIDLTHSIHIHNNDPSLNNIRSFSGRFLFLRRPGVGFYNISSNLFPYIDNSDSKLESIKHYTQRKAKNNFNDGRSGFVDYYKILSLDKGCSVEDVKNKYNYINNSLKSLPGVDQKLRSDIDDAYKTLSDKKLRDEYDKNYDLYSNSDDVHYLESPELTDDDDSSEELQISIIDDEDEEDEPELDLGGNIFGNFFSNLFGSGKPERRKSSQSHKIRPSSKHDVFCNAEVDLKTLLLGGEVTIPVRKWDNCNFCNFNESASKSYIDICSRCNGEGMEHKEKRSPFGFVRTSRTCMKCQGTGYQRLKDCNKCENTGRILKDTNVKFEVPFNSKVGSVITIKGQGHSGGFHTKDGNLHVKLKLKENKNEYIEAGRVVTVYNIPYTKAILGDTVTVSTFMGEKQVKIPEYSQQGDEIKIGTYKNLDHYLKLNVQLPKNLSKSELEMLNKMDKN